MRTYTALSVLLAFYSLVNFLTSCTKKPDLIPAPTAGFSYAAGAAGEISFSDESKEAATYEWDFGDGSAKSTDKAPKHVYAKNGTYRVSQTVTNASGSNSLSKAVVVSTFPAPQASFSVVLGADGAVTFTNTSTNADSYGWDFGDGSSSDDKVPATHSYAKNGPVSISLTATGKGGSHKVSQQVSIISNKPAPDFTWTESDGTVLFSNQSKNADTYIWDFGDGKISTDLSPTNTYTKNGTYTVTLTAVNQTGSVRKTVPVTVVQVVPVNNINQTLYIGNEYGLIRDHLIAIDAKTGAVNWKSADLQGGLARGNPTVWNRLVFGAGEDKLYALNTADGILKWETRLAATYSSPVVVEGTLFVASTDKTVVAFNAATGARKWSFSMSDEVWGGPLIVNGTLFIGDASGNFYALDAASGVKKWSLKVSQGFFGTAHYSNSTVYAAAQDGNLYAFSATDGRQLWKAAVGNAYRSSPVSSAKFIYIVGGGTTLFCLNKTDGTMVWTHELNTFYQSNYCSPALFGNLVYVTEENKLVALDATTGARKWTFSGKKLLTGHSPTLSNGILYIHDTDGTQFASKTFVHALNALTGTVVFTTELEGLIGLSCVVDENGNVAHSGQSGAGQR